MRLWHIDLIPYLPKSQLIAQWRELNSIFKKQDNHILINYIYNYPKYYLQTYSKVVMYEILHRGYAIRNLDNYDKYFAGLLWTDEEDVFAEHDDEYLTICYYNLKEKYLRGQNDFTNDVWNKLDDFYKRRIK